MTIFNVTPMGASNAGGMKKLRFSVNISLYLGNDTRQSHNYYGMKIGTIPKLLNDTIFDDLQ